MSLNIAVIDKSEIIKKMISHSLHYYAAEVYRFETLDDFESQKNHIKPDILFVDWELKKENKPLALSASENIKNVPVVAMYKDENDNEIKEFPHRVKKPIDPSLLRKIVSSIVHKAGESKIHDFLEYPKNEKEEIRKSSGVYESTENLKVEDEKPTLDLESSQEKTISKKTSIPNLELNTNVSIKDFNDYKDSLEFETLVENTLKGLAQDLSKKILEKEMKTFIESAFDNFTNTKEFPVFFSDMLKKTRFEDIFQKELEKFVANQLPHIAKEVIEKKIDKILEDKE